MFDYIKKQILGTPFKEAIKNITIDIKNKVIETPFSKTMLYLLITTGLIILISFLFSLDNENYRAPFAILLASQIAGFSIIYTINNTNKIEQKKEEADKIKTQKVLNAYFSHLIVLANEQIDYFTQIETTINQQPTRPLENLMIIETSFEDELNTIAFVNPLESMLNPDLHKYSDEEILNLILNIKAKVLEMIHTMKIIKTTLIKMNERESVLSMLNHMKNETNKIISSCEKHTN